MNRRPEPSPALAELLAATGELDRILDGRGLTFEKAEVIGPTGPPPQPFVIEPPDWRQEELERQAAERKAQALQDAAELEAAEEPSRPTPPAKRRWRP